MATIKQFEDLEIWQMARDFTRRVYDVYSTSPSFQKDYRLWNQLNGSSGSVMDNIAEGFERGGRNEFVNFLSIAKASLAESKSQLYRALDRQHFTEDDVNSLHRQAVELGKRVGAMMKYLNQSDYQGSKFKNRTTPTRNPKS